MGSSSIQDIRDAIGRGLSGRLPVERHMPDQLKTLLRQLERTDEERADEERKKRSRG
jgi:hypothetical protein